MSAGRSAADEAREVMHSIASPFEGMARIGKDGLVHPYLCPAGVPTISRGVTAYLDGRRVTLNDPPLSVQAAEHLYEMTLPAYLFGVLKVSPVLARYPRAWGALGSWAYNFGVPRYRASTLRRRVDAEDWDAARAEILRWNRAGGRVLRGLVLRREVEARMLP